MSESSIKERLRSKSKTDQREANMALNASTPGSDVQTGSAKKAQMQIPQDNVQPGEITVETIWQVLQGLVSTVNNLRDDFSQAKGTVHFESFQSVQESFASRLDQVEELLSKTKTKLNLIGNLLIRQDEKIEVVQDQVL